MVVHLLYYMHQASHLAVKVRDVRDAGFDLLVQVVSFVQSEYSCFINSCLRFPRFKQLEK